MTDQAEPIAADIAAPVVAAADVAEPVNDNPDAVFEEVARQMGHSPRDKWKGDPDKWIDAKTFILNTPKVIKSTKEQLERNMRVATQQMEKVRREAIADAKARIEAAAAAGDPEAATRATDDLERATARPEPAVEAFQLRNAWYGTDKKATALAVEAAQEVADRGGSVQDQLAAAEKEVRKRFPDLYDDDTPEPAPRTPPAVQGGQRTAAPAAKKTGWNDLPAHVRSAWTPRRLSDFSMTQAEFAEAYFKENA